jgi:hypothetical protein
MKTRMMWIVVAMAAFLVLAAGAAGAIPALLAPGDPVAGKINYQGRLTDPEGLPLDGTFTMRFQVYNDPAAGVLQWDSNNVSVDVDNGLFNVGLNVGADTADFNGQGLWLRIYVNGEWLSPRQELLPVPYALSLKPGAVIYGSSAGAWLLKVQNSADPATGAAVWGEAATSMAVYGRSLNGIGVYGYTNDGYAVSGSDIGTEQARGYGGYFSSVNGVGVYGSSSAQRTANNTHAPGVYGRSTNGVGVYGVGDNASGVRGESAAGSGVYGRTNSGDPYLTAGVWGYGGGSTGIGIRGYRDGLGAGVMGTTYGASGGSGTIGDSESFVGVWAESGSDYGLHAQTGAASNNYGVYTPDNIWSLNYHLSGAIMHLAQNGGSEPLEPGDVVAFSGVAAPLEEGGPPVIQVTRATPANSAAVAGVAYRRFNIKTVTDERSPFGSDSEEPRQVTLEGPVPPGEYLLVVIQGPALVRASKSGGAIRPGDLLSASGLDGYAAKAPEVTVEGVQVPIPGTVFGKALQPLDADRDLIYVFVTLQ